LGIEAESFEAKRTQSAELNDSAKLSGRAWARSRCAARLATHRVPHRRRRGGDLRGLDERVLRWSGDRLPDPPPALARLRQRTDRGPHGRRESAVHPHVRRALPSRRGPRRAELRRHVERGRSRSPAVAARSIKARSKTGS